MIFNKGKIKLSYETIGKLKEENISRRHFKYYLQRYSLFSKYDNGINIDPESWFSVTPECVARHQALKVIFNLFK